MNFERIDKYDYLIAMAALEANLSEAEQFKNIDTSDVVIDDNTRKRVEKLIRTSQKSENKQVTKVRRVFSRVAVIALVVITLLFTTMMSISAVREAVWNTVLEWYDKYFSVSYEPSTPAAPPSTILEIRRPALVPLGMEENVVFDGISKYCTEYYLKDDLCLVFTQTPLGKEGKSVDGEESSRRDVVVGNSMGLLISYGRNNNCCVTWNDGEYQYTLKGYNVEEDLLILIADSVK